MPGMHASVGGLSWNRVMSCAMGIAPQVLGALGAPQAARGPGANRGVGQKLPTKICEMAKLNFCISRIIFGHNFELIEMHVGVNLGTTVDRPQGLLVEAGA